MSETIEMTEAAAGGTIEATAGMIERIEGAADGTMEAAADGSIVGAGQDHDRVHVCEQRSPRPRRRSARTVRSIVLPGSC